MARGFRVVEGFGVQLSSMVASCWFVASWVGLSQSLSLNPKP